MVPRLWLDLPLDKGARWTSVHAMISSRLWFTNPPIHHPETILRYELIAPDFRLVLGALAGFDIRLAIPLAFGTNARNRS